MSFAEYETATAPLSASAPTCPHCQSQHLKRRIGRIALAKSEDARMDAMMDDSALAGLDEDDPRSIGKFMRKMSREMGEDMGEEFDEVVDRLMTFEEGSRLLILAPQDVSCHDNVNFATGENHAGGSFDDDF